MRPDQLDALREAATEGTVTCDGLRVDGDANGFVFETPDGAHRGLDEAGLRRVAAENPWFVSNWHYWTRDRPDADRAFLRWIERADGSDDGRDGEDDGDHDGDDREDDVDGDDDGASDGDDDGDGPLDVRERYRLLADGASRTWGQVLVTASLGDHGERRYHLRHEADADADLTALDVHADPLVARDIVRYDDRGRYRPLKTAPSLRRGWAFTDLDGRDCTRTVDLIYPATVANWYLECQGELDVSHYRETAERQTGIYDLIDELPAEAVPRVAEACCVDSQCLKRRQWDEDADTPLDVPRGDGEFPCREPCSLVVAAAREWTKLEREEPRTYEFELAPGEKEQLETIVDAVADDRVDEIREGDVGNGANRWRVRYLRAKLFDEDGDPGGTATEE